MNQFQTKQFKKLAKEWNQRLAESGFADIEVDLKGDRSLKQRSTNAFRQATEVEREARLEYFRIVGQMVHETKFTSPIDKIVMAKHCEGISITDIVSDLFRLGHTRHRQTVRFIIRRWQTQWGIKNWSLEQMNLKAIK